MVRLEEKAFKDMKNYHALLAMNDTDFLNALVTHLESNFDDCAKCMQKGKCPLSLSIPIWSFLHYARKE